MKKAFLIAGTVLVLVSPASADAATFCVGTSCAAGPNTKSTLQAALDAANTNGGNTRDRIEVYGSLAAANADVASGNPVDIVGAGPGSSTITGVSGSTSVPVLRVRNASSTVSGLSIRIPAAPTGGGLQLESASASNVDVAPASGVSSGPNGVIISGPGALTRSTVAVGSGTAIQSSVAAGQTAVVEDARLAGATGLSSNTSGTGRLAARRVDITADGYGVFAIGSGGTTQVTSSRVVMAAGATAAMYTIDSPTNPALQIRGVTAIGGSGVSGIWANATSPSTAPSANVRDTILRGFSVDLQRSGNATLAVRYSDFDPAKVIDASPAAIAYGPGNVNVDPGFAAPENRLAATSPLIDAGDPAALDVFDSTTDLAGAPRLNDGNGDGAARSDIGAYEYQRPVPVIPVIPPPAKDTVAPGLSRVSLSKSTFRVASKSTAVGAAARKKKKAPAGTTLKYRLSEAATVKIAVQQRTTGARIKRKGKRVCAKRTKSRKKAKKCTRYVAVKTLTRKGKTGANSIAFTGRIAKKALKPGRYRLRLTAIDAAGNKSGTRSVSFKIVR